MAIREPHVDAKAWRGLLVAGAASAAACTVFAGKTFVEGAGGAGGPGDAALEDRAEVAVDVTTGCGCASTTAVACDDFETAALDVRWEPGATAPTLDSSRAHCGARALRVRSEALAANQSAFAGLADSRILADPRLANNFFARAWIYIPSSPPLPAGNYFALFEVRQDVDPFHGVALELHSDESVLNNWGTGSRVQLLETAPRDRWSCVEWQMAFDPATGNSRMWLDGSTDPSLVLGSGNTSPNPHYGSFLVGAFVGTVAPQPAFEFWIDDLVIDDERIGCGG